MSKMYPKQTRRKTYDQDQPELESKQRQSLIIKDFLIIPIILGSAIPVQVSSQTYMSWL